MSCRQWIIIVLLHHCITKQLLLLPFILLYQNGFLHGKWETFLLWWGWWGVNQEPEVQRPPNATNPFKDIIRFFFLQVKPKLRSKFLNINIYFYKNQGWQQLLRVVHPAFSFCGCLGCDTTTQGGAVNPGSDKSNYNLGAWAVNKSMIATFIAICSNEILMSKQLTINY